jgi:hypothetical protein
VKSLSQCEIKAVFKLNFDFTHSVDWSGMCETPAGVRDRGDPTGAKRRGGSPERPRKAKHMERKSTDKFNKAKITKYWTDQKFFQFFYLVC